MSFVPIIEDGTGHTVPLVLVSWVAPGSEEFDIDDIVIMII